jgi:hypothetical protein
MPTRSSQRRQMPRPDELTGVCVGGPFEGRQITTLYGDTFVAPAALPVATGTQDNPLTPTETARFVRYRYRALRRDFGIWAPVEMTTTDALRTLIAAYLSRG